MREMEVRGIMTHIQPRGIPGHAIVTFLLGIASVVTLALPFFSFLLGSAALITALSMRKHFVADDELRGAGLAGVGGIIAAITLVIVIVRNILPSLWFMIPLTQ